MADFLTIGTSGLQAYRRSLEVTGNNIVNANTEGYARRDVQLQGVGDAASSPTNIRTGSGSGVAVDVVRRATDVFVQAEKRLTQSASSAATALADRLDRLEKSMFSGDGDLGKLSQTLFSRLQDFATTPFSIAVRTTVIQAANDLAAGFNVQAKRLENESLAIVTDAQSQFDDLNALTKQLAELNKQIESMGSEKGKANDLLDQRDKLVDGIVRIVGVTVESRPSGAVNLYLSDGTGGPQLVGPTGAKTLQASRINGHLQITMDPYGANIPISKVSGGVVGGIESFDDQITSMANQLDRMAVGFAKRVNDQHQKGADLDGEKGLPLFSTDTFTITAAKSNRGLVSAALDMGQVAAVEPGDYRASFSQADGKWTIVNQISGKNASGAENVSIDGMTIRFTGQPVNGDVFTFSPLVNAASGMRVLFDDPRQLAASLPQLAEAVAGNKSSATIDLIDTSGRIDPPNIPSLLALFNQSLSPENAIKFKSDAIISAIPSGSMADPKSPITLYSFGELSSATFKVDLKKKSSDTTSASSQNVVHGFDNSRVYIDTDLGILNLELFPDGLPSSLADSPNSAQILADEINRVFESQTRNNIKVSDAFFASTNGEFITINGLGTHEINYAALKNDDSANSLISTATTTKRATAADLNILTREGIQISGNSLTSSSLIRDFNGKAFNGFLDTATAPSAWPENIGATSTYAYRNLTITDSRRPISDIGIGDTPNRTRLLSFDATPESDSPSFSPSASNATPGAVYSLKVEGLSSPLRLAGSAIAGKGSADLAPMMLGKLNELAPQRQIIGGTIDFSDLALADLGKATFDLTIDGQSAVVTFTRSSDVKTGAYLPTGTFSVTWASSVKNPPAVKLTMQSIPAGGPQGGSRLIIDLPKSLSATPPSLSITGADAAKLGLSGNAVSEQIIAAQDMSLIIPKKTNQGSASASLTVIDSTQANSGIYTLTHSNTAPNWTITKPDNTTSTYSSLPITIDGMKIEISGSAANNDAFQFSADANNALQLTKENIPSGLSLTGSQLDLVNGRIRIRKSISDISTTTSLQNLKTTTVTSTKVMASFGFLGSDLTATLQDKAIALNSAITDAGSTVLTDTSQSVSRIGHKVTITSNQTVPSIPEDLLIALQKSGTSGIRSVAARFEAAPMRTNPAIPDIEVKVKADGVLEIYELKTDSKGALLLNDKGVPIEGSLLGKRTYKPGVPVDYMGAKFVIEGNADIDDVFRITTDLSRTGDNRNALALIDIGHTDLLDKGSGSFADLFAAAVSKIGSSTQAAKTTATAAKTVADNVAAAFDSATGVNLDTEAAELIKLQQAYSACAQIVSTARDLFDMLLRSF